MNLDSVQTSRLNKWEYMLLLFAVLMKNKTSERKRERLCERRADKRGRADVTCGLFSLITACEPSRSPKRSLERPIYLMHYDIHTFYIYIE